MPYGQEKENIEPPLESKKIQNTVHKLKAHIFPGADPTLWQSCNGFPEVPTTIEVFSYDPWHTYLIYFFIFSVYRIVLTLIHITFMPSDRLFYYFLSSAVVKSDFFTNISL